MDTTPTATLGIRGTTGLVEVPDGAAANNPNNVAIKLYPDADGRVGQIEVNDRAGARLGFLTQGASGFTIRPGAGGSRFAAVPLVISQAVGLRDQGFVRQLHSTQNFGRQVVFQQREFRRANLVVFVESINTFDGTIRNVFLQSVEDGKDAITVARYGSLQVAANGAGSSFTHQVGET